MIWERRCVYCRQRVWPWQRQGWRVLPGGKFLRWHGECYLERRAQ